MLRASDSFSASCPSSAEDSCASERFALDRQAIRLRRRAAQLVFELLDARALHLRGLVRGALLRG